MIKDFTIGLLMGTIATAVILLPIIFDLGAY
jgi:hypothetical protein